MTTIDETFDPANLTRLDTSSSLTATKSLSAVPKSAKSMSNYPRIELESIYTDLKESIGHKWDLYFDAVTRFCRGDLHAHEFGDLTDELLYSADQTIHLHNRFICAVAFNSARDGPDPGIAAWVTAASDKAAIATGSKPAGATSDAGEQRLKKEVMAIHARDRRRLKNIQTDADGKVKDLDDSAVRRNEYEEAYNASKYKVPEVTNTNASGLTKTNLEPEIKKRYQQTLYLESGEFPDAANVFARMVPICYEEAIPQGSSIGCAEVVVSGAEFFLKDFLSTVFERVRANGPTYEYLSNGHDGQFGGGIFTDRYRKQVEREAEAVKNNTLQRTREDEMLPEEYAASKGRRPLGINDIKLANRVGPTLWNRVPLLGFELELNDTENEYDEWNDEQSHLLGQKLSNNTNGHQENGTKTDDEMDIDDDDLDWDEEGHGGRGALDSLIDDCLAIPA